MASNWSLANLPPHLNKRLVKTSRSAMARPEFLESGLKMVSHSTLPFLPRAATEQLIKQGKIASGSLVNVIRAPFGMGIRSGAQKPDTSSPDAFKRSLQAARMIVYTDPATGGVSGVFFAGVLEKLSITDEIKQKCKLTAGVLNAQYVASGEADIAVQMKHEIVAVPGIEFVPMPSELTGGVTFTASVGAHATNADAANSLVHFLTGPTAMPLIKAKGMEPG